MMEADMLPFIVEIEEIKGDTVWYSISLFNARMVRHGVPFSMESNGQSIHRSQSLFSSLISIVS